MSDSIQQQGGVKVRAKLQAPEAGVLASDGVALSDSFLNHKTMCTFVYTLCVYNQSPV